MQRLPKYIYLSPPLIFPTTYNGIRTKNRPVWITPGAAPIRWMGPIRNPRWEQKRTEGYVIVSKTIRIANPWISKGQKWYDTGLQDYTSIDDINWMNLFMLVPSTATRDHSLKIFKKQCRTTQRLHMRIIDQWNGLSNSTVTSKSVNAFKSALNAEDWNPYKFTCSC